MTTIAVICIFLSVSQCTAAPEAAVRPSSPTRGGGEAGRGGAAPSGRARLGTSHAMDAMDANPRQGVVPQGRHTVQYHTTWIPVLSCPVLPPEPAPCKAPSLTTDGCVHGLCVCAGVRLCARVCTHVRTTWQGRP